MDPRDNAIETGQKFYTTGRPCKRDHNGLRYASTGQCVQCLTENNINLKEKIRKAKIVHNSALLAGFMPYTTHVPTVHHPIVSTLSDILRRGSPEQIEQCNTILTIIKESIK